MDKNNTPNNTPLSKERTEKLIHKVQMLFNLAGNNPEQIEAQVAALKAQELIAKYNLTITDTEEQMEMSEASYETGIDKSFKYALANTICDNFRCHCWWLGRRRVVFMGYKTDVEVAKATFEFLFKTCEKGARRECRKAYKLYGTETGVYYSYTRGFVAGIKEKLDAQCVALMVITPPEVTEAYKVKTESFKTVSKFRNGGEERFDRSSYGQGKRDGRAAMNSRAIEGEVN